MDVRIGISETILASCLLVTSWLIIACHSSRHHIMFKTSRGASSAACNSPFSGESFTYVSLANCINSHHHLQGQTNEQMLACLASVVKSLRGKKGWTMTASLAKEPLLYCSPQQFFIHQVHQRIILLTG